MKDNEEKLKSVTLKFILKTFGAPISEEHAWALLYLGISKMVKTFKGSSACYLVRGLDSIIITPEGDVDEKTFRANSDPGRRVMTNLATGLAEFAVLVYDALDWELSFERQLGEELESLIDMMTSADEEEQDDEGIGIGDEESSQSICQKVFETCQRHYNLVSRNSIKYLILNLIYFRMISTVLEVTVLTSVKSYSRRLRNFIP